MTEHDEYARQMTALCRSTLERNGHTDCNMLARAHWLPDSQRVMCGCGAFADAPELAEEQPTPDGTGVVRLGPGGELEYEPRDPIESALALIDPTHIYTPEEVERHILDVLARLECGALFERQTVERHHRAVDAWDRAFFRAINTSQATSADKRKAEAMVACDDAGLSREKFEAEMVREAAKSTMHNLRSVLSGYQSVARSVGVMYQAGGSPGRP